MELGQEGVAKREFQQIMNVATAASKNESLEHLILHTLPSGVKLGGKERWVAHMDVSLTVRCVIFSRTSAEEIHSLRTMRPMRSRSPFQSSRRKPHSCGLAYSCRTFMRTQ